MSRKYSTTLTFWAPGFYPAKVVDYLLLCARCLLLVDWSELLLETYQDTTTTISIEWL